LTGKSGQRSEASSGLPAVGKRQRVADRVPGVAAACRSGPHLDTGTRPREFPSRRRLDAACFDVVRNAVANTVPLAVRSVRLFRMVRGDI
jgi:hypothetical protein